MALVRARYTWRRENTCVYLLIHHSFVCLIQQEALHLVPVPRQSEEEDRYVGNGVPQHVDGGFVEVAARSSEACDSATPDHFAVAVAWLEHENPEDVLKKPLRDAGKGRGGHGWCGR